MESLHDQSISMKEKLYFAGCVISFLLLWWNDLRNKNLKRAIYDKEYNDCFFTRLLCSFYYHFDV